MGLAGRWQLSAGGGGRCAERFGAHRADTGIPECAADPDLMRQPTRRLCHHRPGCIAGQCFIEAWAGFHAGKLIA